MARLYGVAVNDLEHKPFIAHISRTLALDDHEHVGCREVSPWYGVVFVHANRVGVLEHWGAQVRRHVGASESCT